jgi:hypothetical protein
MNLKEINSFDQIPIDLPNTLVICDIDDTLLHFPGLTSEKYKEILEYFNSINTDQKIALNNANNYWFKIFYQTVPIHTDKNGFSRLLSRLDAKSGGLCFLTARPGHQSNIEFTRSNFYSLNLNYDVFKIYYSWTIPKGEFIKNQINLTDYTNIIFIDDMEYNLLNVNSHFGSQIKCYKFVK